MAQTLEELQAENEQLQLKIQELEKEIAVVKNKNAHDKWVSGRRGRGVK